VDAIDRRIVELLMDNARRPLADIADRVGLSPAPVKRRIDRLESDGVIDRYTAVVNYAETGAWLEAFAEVRVLGATDIEEVFAEFKKLPEIIEAFTIAGDPDALVRLRVENVHHLQRVVNLMRKSGKVAGTKTLIVMAQMGRGSSASA